MENVAVVTGAGRGIGRAIAELLVHRGYAVVVTDIDADAARRTAEEIGAVEGLAQDVSDEAGHAAVAEVAAGYGRLTVWVNNAGVGDDGTLEQVSSESVRRLVDVNLLGVVWGMRTALSAFGAHRSGDVVNVASASGLGPVPGLAVYAATKAAVVSLTTSAACEVPKGIRVHALCPDGVDTDMVRAMREDGQAKALVHSSGRLLTIDEVAAEAVALIGSRRRGADASRLARPADPGGRFRAVAVQGSVPALRAARASGHAQPRLTTRRSNRCSVNPCFVRTHDLTSYMCSIEQSFDPPLPRWLAKLSVGLRRTSVMNTTAGSRPRRSEMSSFAITPGFAPTRVARSVRPMPAVRLTRRGRLALTVLFLGVVLAVLTAFGATSAASGEAGEPVPTRIVMVDEGDTLWAIASEVAAPGEVREMVHRIERLNALSGAGVYVGQRIAVPVE